MPKIPLSSFKRRFMFFGRNSGLHGLAHLFKSKHFLAKLFWLTIIVVSAGCLYLLLEHDSEGEKSTSFTPDTLYLNWTTVFPAVTVCESGIGAPLEKKMRTLYPQLMKPLSYSQGWYIIHSLYGSGRCSKDKCFPCGGVVPCDVPWRKVMENLHSKCEELINDCAYIGRPFPCCNNFHMVDSEHGPCYSFNSMQSAKSLKESLFTVNLTTGPGILTFRLLHMAVVSIHNADDLSTDLLDMEYKYVKSDFEAVESVLFSVIEMENKPMVQDIDIEERQCRFAHEIPNEPLHTYPVYSYGACELARTTEGSFESCGCISPIRDRSYEKYYCNFTGLHCLNEYEAKIRLGLGNVKKRGKCLPSCVENEIFIMHLRKKILTPKEVEDPTTLVTIRMSSLPHLRYQRNVLSTNLDFVVNVGGMAGLFFGASVLSVVELFYLILRAPSKSAAE